MQGVCLSVGAGASTAQGGVDQSGAPVRLLVGCTARPAEPVGPLPNKRLKLTAPGVGKNCVCALASSVVVSINVALACVGAAA